MQNRLEQCAAYLREVEEKLSQLKASVDADQQHKLVEALSFIQQARNAISETKTRVNSLNISSQAD